MSIRRIGLIPRPQFVRDALIFVIAVEGAETEKQYFSLFESTRVHIEILPAGASSLSAPKHVLERLVKFEEQYDLGPEDERCCQLNTPSRQGQTFLPTHEGFPGSNISVVAIRTAPFHAWLAN